MSRVLACLCVAGIFAIALVTRFSYPEMTETQLMIAFWPRWLLAGGLGGVATILSYHTK